MKPKTSPSRKTWGRISSAISKRMLSLCESYRVIMSLFVVTVLMTKSQMKR
jgi:hypothetical protein